MATLPGGITYPAVRMPAVLNGKPNGKLPSDILVTMSMPGGGSAVMLNIAARAFKAMMASAPQIRWMQSGDYRTYDEQVTLLKARYVRVSYSADIYWDGSWWDHVSGATVAKPGTSNHGWGLALDLAENLDADSQAESISQAAVDWLVANAYRFGIGPELKSEPWHWRYFAGDTIPQAVIDYELKEDDLMLCKKGDRDLAKDGKVTALQKLVLEVDASLLPRFGADGDYGSETAAALVALGITGGDASGNTYGPHEYAKLAVKLAAKYAGKDGEDGEDGEQGIQGIQGVKGDKGDAAVLPPNAILQILEAPPA